MVSLPEFADLVGQPVQVQLVKGGAGPSTLTGNLFTVDPVTNDIVIVTFTEEKKPDTMKWLPRDAFSQVQAVDGQTAGCHPKTAELDGLFSGLFKQEQNFDAAEAKKRKTALMAWLKRNHVEVKQDGISLMIFGCVRVEPPYSSKECYCDNEIVLRRVRGMVDKCPPPA